MVQLISPDRKAASPPRPKGEQSPATGPKTGTATAPVARTLRRICGVFKPYRKELFVAGLCILGGAGLGIWNALLIRSLFDRALNNRSLGRLAEYTALLFLVPSLINLFALAQSVLIAR